MSFDLSKCEKDSNGHLLCRKKNGKSVRIICTDRNHQVYKLIGLTGCDGHEALESFTTGGRSNASFESSEDLVNLTRKVKRWVNIYPGYVTGGFSALTWETEEEANRRACQNRIACVPIEWEEPS